MRNVLLYPAFPEEKSEDHRVRLTAGAGGASAAACKMPSGAMPGARLGQGQEKGQKQHASPRWLSSFCKSGSGSGGGGGGGGGGGKKGVVNSSLENTQAWPNQADHDP